MSDTTKSLLAEIEAFLIHTGMRASTFGHKTAKDGKMVDRLRRGGTVTLDTASVIRAFMSSQLAQHRITAKMRPKKAA